MGKERIINQLSENNESKEAENATLQQDVADLGADLRKARACHSATVLAMRSALRDADAELATALETALETALATGAPARSIGTDPVSTDTVGTATHHCAVTQTADSRILPEHLARAEACASAPTETGAASEDDEDAGAVTKTDAAYPLSLIHI